MSPNDKPRDDRDRRIALAIRDFVRRRKPPIDKASRYRRRWYRRRPPEPEHIGSILSRCIARIIARTEGTV
jgi:hypothetical protein